ncbi:DUF305 domain-containing protein [Serinicoccus chungangensis]|uniref:DUF305 domain-containing protein n=1 Tax=Serinicoccus chungangensis TaxID=767452 RepID=UPI0009FADB79|nr:DUF305 domain-containing protein [Serinicoccus chungangensis]
MGDTTNRTRRLLRTAATAVLATTLSVAYLPGAVQADPDDIETSDNMTLLSNTPKQAPLEGFNSDIAFWGDYAFQGNYDGFRIWDISKPRDPELVTQVLCPGGQGDVSVSEDGSLLFMSVDSPRSDDTCSSTSGSILSPTSWEGMRIFDISDLESPDYVKAVRTDCGSHTHTLVPGEDEGTNYLYVSSYGPNSRFPNCQPPHDGISVVEVPTEDPASAAVVSEPVLFPEGGGPGTSGCHDITAYPERDLAAGACMGDGILMDISDPVNPVVTEQVQDSNFAFWHSATFNDDGSKVVFTDELGGGGAATCNEAVGPNRGANAIFDIAYDDTASLDFRSYYKIPRYQEDTENCVAHNGSIIPVVKGDVMVQAWYQGGVSVFDFTDSDNPEEIAYFDRGPIDDDNLVLGGSWSAYYYNGHIYSSDITQGLDVLKVRGTKGDNRVKMDFLNAQTQYESTPGRSGSRPGNAPGLDGKDVTSAVVPAAPGASAQVVPAPQAERLVAQSRHDLAHQSGEADTMFMSMMVPHHYQAILMSQLAEDRMADPQLAALADRMLLEQELEIDVMQGWQGAHGHPVTDEVAAYEQMVADPAMREQMGMASPEQMQQLAEAEGAAFDTLFVELMVPHHEGAIDMAVDEIIHGSDVTVQQLATDMMVTQAVQIDQMQRLVG